MSDKKTITVKEWHDEGKRLYGEDKKKWKFKCCMCGHIQSFETFKENTTLSNEEIEGQVCFSCEGRSNGKGHEAFNKTKYPKDDCTYTCGGFFQFNTLIVDDGEGEKYNIFEFADK